MVERNDVEAALEARRELGKEYEPAIVDSLVEKIEKRLDERKPAHTPSRTQHELDFRVVLGSIGLGVGATAIATGNHQGWVAVIAWLAIVLVNIAYYRR
jgi:hypothetical protein